MAKMYSSSSLTNDVTYPVARSHAKNTAVFTALFPLCTYYCIQEGV